VTSFRPGILNRCVERDPAQRLVRNRETNETQPTRRVLRCLCFAIAPKVNWDDAEAWDSVPSAISTFPIVPHHSTNSQFSYDKQAFFQGLLKIPFVLVPHCSL
jgi:hypothetical protein